MTLQKQWPYASIMEQNPLRTTACEKCPRCRDYTKSDKTQVYVAQLGLSYHKHCYYGDGGLQ